MPIYKAEGKKDGLQKYLVKISYREDGKKHDLTRVAYGRAEALALERHLFQGIKKEPSHRKVRELYEEYMVVKKSEIRETSYEKIEIAFRHHILPYIGSIPIEDLTTQKLQQWKNALNETELSVRTKNNTLAMLKGMLNFAVKMDYLQKAPSAERFRDAYEVPKEGVIQYYTPEEFVRFIAAATVKNHIHQGLLSFFLIAYYTGARKGEINALRWTDFDGSSLKITKSVNVKGKTPRETPPKNKSSYRTIQLPMPLIDALNQQKETQKEFPGFSEDWRICGGPCYLADTTIDRFNRDTAAAAGLPHIRVHDFRHSHASLLANNGINIQEVARRLGHANVHETWKTYSHLYPKEEERALKVLNSIPTFYRQN